MVARPARRWRARVLAPVSARRPTGAPAVRASTARYSRGSSARYLRAVLLRNRNHMRRRQRATSRSWSFFECPYIGDNPEHLVLPHAAAEKRLHRTAGAAIDDGEHAWVGQRLRVDDVFADQGWAHLSGAVGAVANNAIRRIKFLAVSDRVSVGAIFIDAGVWKRQQDRDSWRRDRGSHRGVRAQKSRLSGYDSRGTRPRRRPELDDPGRHLDRTG